MSRGQLARFAAQDPKALMRRRGPDDEQIGCSVPGGAMSARIERRRAIRVPVALNAHYSSGPEEGIGVLANISYSGALIEGSSVQPTVGSRVRVYVFVESADPIAPASPYELVGRVVRHSSSGFAIEYEDADPEVRQLVDAAASFKH